MSADHSEPDGKAVMEADGYAPDGHVPEDETPAPTEKPQRRTGLKTCCSSCTRPLQTKYNPLPSEPTLAQTIKHGFLCPPHGKLAKYCMFVVMLFVAWAVMISVTGAQGLPGGNFFSLVILFFACVIGGYLVVYIRLLPLLGKGWCSTVNE